MKSSPFWKVTGAPYKASTWDASCWTSPLKYLARTTLEKSLIVQLSRFSALLPLWPEIPRSYWPTTKLYCRCPVGSVCSKETRKCSKKTRNPKRWVLHSGWCREGVSRRCQFAWRLNTTTTTIASTVVRLVRLEISGRSRGSRRGSRDDGWHRAL